MKTAILDTNSTETLLIDQAVKGDLDAFNQLVEAYQDIAFHHAWTFLKDWQLAEDATQESFIKAYQAIGRFRKGSFRAWLLRIVTNTSYDILRRNKRQTIIPLFPEGIDGDINESPEWVKDTSLSVEETIVSKETGSEIIRLLDELPEIYREILTLVDIYDFEYKEAAQALNIKIGTVKSRLMRARLQMREKLRVSPNFQSRTNPKKAPLPNPALQRKYDTSSQLQWSCT